MQSFFEVAGCLCTIATSTASTSPPALTVMVLTLSPAPPSLTHAEQQLYSRGKEEALRAAAAALGVFPLLVEPQPPAVRSVAHGAAHHKGQ